MTETAIVKLTKEDMTLVGASSPSEFPDKLRAFAAASKKLETAMAETPDWKSFESRIVALETAIKTIPTEARIGEIVGTSVANSVPTSMTAWASSEAGKKLIGAEASRITMEAFAATGTQPAKPAPASADAQAGADAAKNFIAQGKFEEAYPLLTEEARAEFPDAKCYAAFQRANSKGQVRIANSRN